MFSLSQLSLCSPRCTFLSNIVIKSQTFTVKPTLLLPNLAWDCSRKVTEKWLAPAHTSEHKFKWRRKYFDICDTRRRWYIDKYTQVSLHSTYTWTKIHISKFNGILLQKGTEQKKEQTSKQNTLKINYKQHAKQWHYIQFVDARCNGNFYS